MRLRAVELSDVSAMVARDVEATASDAQWILMILADDDEVAGTVTVYEHDGVAEIGWMVLPGFQGQGLAKAAAREVVERSSASGRWGPLHAWAPVSSVASNAVCRSVGFRLLGEESFDFGGQTIVSNHWVA